MSREVVEPWASAMVAAQLVDPRNGRPSMRALALAAETTASTVSAMMHGTRDTQNDVVERVAKALRMEDRIGEVMGWVDRERTQARPFAPHPDANLLTTDEQQAINELIRLLALPKKRGGAEDDSPAATKTPVPGPADQPGNVIDLSTQQPPIAARRNAKRPPRGPQEQKPD